MRWFASLVVLCLLAGSGTRPRVDLRTAQATEKVSAADGLVALVMPRRGAVVPEVRVPPFAIAPLPAAPLPPCRVAVPAPRGPLALFVPAPASTRSARGPPSA